MDDADSRVSSRLTYVEVAAALAMAERHDAVHCASAASLNDTDLVAAAGDTHLLAAWRSLGIAVLDTHHGP